MRETAVLLLGHGSRDPLANAELEAFVAAYREARPEHVVEHAFIELAAPLLDDALASLSRRAARVVVVPLMLFGAGHVKNDVPLALARARTRSPNVTFAAAPALGVHPGLASLAFDRAAAFLPSHADGRAETLLVVVGRGSSDPDANGDFCKVVRLIGEGRGLFGVEPTFMGITRPEVAETLERVARIRPARVVVVPYLLFAGRLVAKLRTIVAAFAERHPWIRIAVAPHLGACAEVYAAIDERVDRALRGHALLPCDTCQYRTALPGFVEQVGGLRALLYSVRHTLTHAEAVSHEHAHKPLKKHVLVCTGTNCAERGSLVLIDELRRRIKDAGQRGIHRVTRTGCLGRCGEGPTVAVYPDGVWYRGVRDGDAKALVDEHLLADRLVGRLVDHVMG